MDPNSQDYLFRNYNTLTDEDKAMMSCDETFALYLREVARKSSKEFYQQIARFIFHFRDCVNKYCWEKKIESEDFISTVEPGADAENMSIIQQPSEETLRKAKHL